MQCLQDTDSLSYAYRWIKKNGTFSLRVQGINSSSLTILNLMPKDSGDYRCVVSNRTGEISSNYSSINIIGKGECMHIYIAGVIMCVHFNFHAFTNSILSNNHKTTG